MNKKAGLLVLMFPCALFANEWKGEGELGYTSTSGNSDSESLNTKLSVSKEKDKWRHKAAIEALKTSTDNVTSSDRFVFTEKTEYKFGKKTYSFMSLRYEDDEFTDFVYQSSISFGIGSRFIESDVHVFDASAGLGYRRTKDDLTMLIHEDGILKLEANYKYTISENAVFSEDILVESGDENTHSESVTALKTKINGNLSSKISYTVKRNSDVAVGTEKTDTVTTVSLIYGF
ncbi:MAG: DUF481 domain-containing protein [Gammaproteobacteria bacterium]|nr:DUF481 domain-containing protein [Gammaproteobacteria bacterium]MCW8910894.1 DUF481 domain-containing protein [Gammaproteobacteria bacterium]MCW9005395.1 DUF481 domain-containing protein [Gammaproteobacteria bacterium]MCW9056708.1 DUF481 domain-containing protein [Gammaproteobacteria bacterium]